MRPHRQVRGAHGPGSRGGVRSRSSIGLPERYPLHEDLANAVLEGGLEEDFDFALSWSAPLDHAFLSPVTTLVGDGAVPPLVPFWVNCFVAPLPMARRCFAAGQHIARVVAEGPWNVAVIATGGLSHFPELSLARVGTSDPAFDRRIVRLLEAGDHEALCALTTKDLHESGSHELLNWMVLIGAVSPAAAKVRFFGEMGRIDLAAMEWRRAMSRYDVNVILYRLKKDAAFRTRFQASPETVLAGADLSEEEYLAFARWDTRRLNELGGSLHLLVSIPHLGAH